MRADGGGGGGGGGKGPLIRYREVADDFRRSRELESETLCFTAVCSFEGVR